jgi:hypothetical protein
MSMNFPKPEGVLRKAMGGVSHFSSRFPPCEISRTAFATISLNRTFSVAHSPCLCYSLRSDLIAVGKEDVALETLHTVLIPRKHRTWSDIYEQVCGPVFVLCALIALELATSDDQTYQK